jgi:SAM-dependent methyltransferase
LDADDLRAVYDRVAEAYAAQFFDELDRKPFDRGLLDEFADRCDAGPVLDLGCGPGHVAQYLRERGVAAEGVDLSPATVAVARRLNPGLPVRVGDLTDLGVADRSVAGIVAFYSLIHLPRAAFPAAARELHRVLRPGGVLLAALHGGAGEVHADEFCGQPVAVEATLYAVDELARLLAEAGFVVEAVLARPPYEFEHPTERLYARATA